MMHALISRVLLWRSISVFAAFSRGLELSQHCAVRSAAAPGTITLRTDAIEVACGDNTALMLNEVQLEGKKRMSAGDFLRGFQLKSGEVLGEIA
jgi:methionyl-tRNA formyltransferase